MSSLYSHIDRIEGPNVRKGFPIECASVLKRSMIISMPTVLPKLTESNRIVENYQLMTHYNF